mmetsp:Transcript_14478/g.25525  ORF Transcript_14478/g.25525 Transcript_14478/m.25525 type:complete len:291 (-) Transcript_14478:49-921(-)
MGFPKGGKGKGFGPCGPHFHHRHHGPGKAVVAAEAALLGAVAGAAVGAVVARPSPVRPPPRPAPVVVVGSAPVVVKGKGKGKGPVVVTTAPQTPFSVRSVQIVPEATEMRGTVTFFCVEVQPEGPGQAWRVMRRYNDFHGLHKNLGSKDYPDAPFPGKHYFGCTGANLDSRRNGLQAWIQRTVQDPSSRTLWARPLSDFLEAGRQFATTMPDELEALPEVSAPAAEPVEPREGGQVLVVQVPDGVQAGQAFAIIAPDGKQMTVEVPEGVVSGAELQLWYDPASGQLVPLV